MNLLFLNKMERKEHTTSLFYKVEIFDTKLSPSNWQVQGIKVAGLSSPVSRMDFCIFTLNLAVGSESGLVRCLSLLTTTFHS